MSDEPLPYPCRAHVTDRKGGVWYCDQGPNGHRGTCCGDKPPYTYQAEVNKITRLRRERRARMENK